MLFGDTVHLVIDVRHCALGENRKVASVSVVAGATNMALQEAFSATLNMREPWITKRNVTVEDSIRAEGKPVRSTIVGDELSFVNPITKQRETWVILMWGFRQKDTGVVVEHANSRAPFDLSDHRASFKPG